MMLALDGDQILVIKERHVKRESFFLADVTL